ncbi:hypothetical protein RM704_10595 [Streptomyces sp. DSM 3412]|uniref:DUF2190 domain-containing protein n=1 Tax=Streptomyces gottesmaniae TaxID=3075518 RepID=A0ABU2YUA6_9ACTN|nr:hypothetical protein [Streptomyces sp. DSM 3412]MDT0567913.1 hypothetical protein [Streptomyces sp. DSM 3412]
MAYQRRIMTQSIRLTGAPVGAATHVVWRAPVACTVVKVHGLRSGGAAAAVNAKIGVADVLAADLTAGNGVFTSGTPTGTAGDMAAGAVLSLEVASGDATTVVIQADIAIDADAYDLA